MRRALRYPQGLQGTNGMGKDCEIAAGDSYECSHAAVATLVASTGVSMYLTKDAVAATLRQVASFAPATKLVMSFMLPLELADPGERVGLQQAAKGARANGTPFVSFFTPSEILTLAHEAGFRKVEHVSSADLARMYFVGRTDSLLPSSAEELMVATV